MINPENISITGVDRCLRFWFHMYGSGMGTLNVYKNNNAGVKEIIFTRSGNQGNLWQEADIFIPATNGLQVLYQFVLFLFFFAFLVATRCLKC